MAYETEEEKKERAGYREDMARESAERIRAKKGRRGGPSGLIGRKRPTRSADDITPDPAMLVEDMEGPEGPPGPAGRSGSGGGQTANPNYSQQIFIALSLAILFVLINAYNRHENVKAGKVAALVNPKYDIVKFLQAWSVIFVGLLAASTFRGPDKVAAAFAWLILVAVLLYDGEAAISSITKTLGTPSPRLGPEGPSGPQGHR